MITALILLLSNVLRRGDVSSFDSDALLQRKAVQLSCAEDNK